MTETAAETTPVTFKQGDRVKVSADANDGAGYAAPERIRGQVGKLDYLDSYSGWLVIGDNGRNAFVGAQYLTLVTEADELRAQIDKLTKELADATTARETQASALDAFKVTVRRAIVNKAEGVYDSDDAEPYDDLLDTIGLEGRERDFEFRVDVSGSYYITVTATSQTAAYDEVTDRGNVREYLRDNIDSDWLDSVDADEQ